MTQLISDGTVSLTLVLRSVAIILTVLVIIDQINQLKVNRIMRTKALLLSLTTVLLLTSILPMWYYFQYSTMGLPTRALSDALVINNTLAVLLPAVIFVILYKQKGDE